MRESLDCAVGGPLRVADDRTWRERWDSSTSIVSRMPRVAWGDPVSESTISLEPPKQVAGAQAAAPTGTALRRPPVPTFTTPTEMEDDAQEVLKTPEYGDSALGAFKPAPITTTPTTVFLLTLTNILAVLGPTAAFLIAYTAVGYGEEVFLELKQHYEVAELLAAAATAVLIVAYILDSFTDRTYRTAKTCILGAALLAFAVGAILAADYYPSAPAVIYVLVLLGLVFASRKYLFPDVPNATFLYSVSAVMATNGVLLLSGWVYWVHSSGHFWRNTATQDHFHGTLDCDLDTEQDSPCLAAFLVWAWPGAISALSLLLAGLAYYLARSARAPAASLQNAHPALRPLGMMVCVLAISIYIVSSIAGVQMGLADVVMQFICLTFVVMCGLLIAAFGRENLKGQLGENVLVKRIKALKQASWIKGMLVLMTLPALIFFLLPLSALNMAIRRCGCLPCSKLAEEADTTPTRDAVHEESERNFPGPYVLSFFTPRVRTLLTYLMSNTTQVFKWAHWIGVLYFSMDVGVGRMTVVLLSAMNKYCDGLSPVAVTLVIFALGMFLFLLPPVPGVPIYLFAGVVMVNSLDREFDNFVLAIWIVTVVCLCIKLAACAIQQKVFGENLGESVAVRRLIGINSIQIRAIRYCLSKPGLSRAKVAILCGGPDWPTSVLCGILRLPLYECLLGTLPVYPVYLSETVIAGAFYLKTGATWEAAAATMLAVCSGAMGMTSFAAIYYIEDTISKHREELEQYPEDEEVAEMDRAEVAGLTAYSKATEWTQVPKVIRAVLVVGTCFMAYACYLFALFSTDCFVTFAVTDSIEDKLDGNPLHVVKFLGWVALSCYGVGCITLFIFSQWAQRATKRELAAMEENKQQAPNPA